jgi:hypothetical protein
MVWPFFVAQTLAMIFLAMIVLGLRDMLRQRSDPVAIKSYLLFLLITFILLTWSVWLLFRAATLLHP